MVFSRCSMVMKKRSWLLLFLYSLNLTLFVLSHSLCSFSIPALIYNLRALIYNLYIVIPVHKMRWREAILIESTNPWLKFLQPSDQSMILSQALRFHKITESSLLDGYCCKSSKIQRLLAHALSIQMKDSQGYRMHISWELLLTAGALDGIIEWDRK